MTPEALAALKTEIANDPAGRGYAGKTAAQQADLMNAGYGLVGVPGVRPIQIGSVVGYLRTRFFMTPIGRYASASPPAGATPQAIEAASELMGMITDPHEVQFNVADPDVVASIGACLGALVAEGVAGRLVNMAGMAFSQQHMNDLLAMGATPAPIFERHARVLDVFLGLEGAPNAVSAEDVMAALP